MSDDLRIVIRVRPAEAESSTSEMCEHKGIGHPDSLCDGVVEAVSLALNRAYHEAYGRIQHYNVDKALLIGGQSRPRFGGGCIDVPMRLIVCGRATALPELDLAVLVGAAAREYLDHNLHCDSSLIQIESAVRCGSPNLQQIFARGKAVALANDTSFGVGFAPLSRLESTVLQLADSLRSRPFRTQFPVAGDDYKIMGHRIGQALTLTLAVAMLDREVESVAHYFALKRSMVDTLAASLPAPCTLQLNMLDDPMATNENGIYLTVTGLSAEQGDDGQVGRGNRMNGLITPCRSMSLEAVAGKNPVAHVGKLYNAAANELATALAKLDPTFGTVSVQILSTIGRPVEKPSLIAIDIAGPPQLHEKSRRQIEAEVHRQLHSIASLSDRLASGLIPAF
ncbi:methionine adenosyltransferase [Permianibacter sp. IMCC34836]|uniref:methionine adenosyltransferase n=1 Tax=Permianibacter fluminis TaxID=2738515 RepID=UPI001556B7C2|nr:methionine adenosyltransferase [Permianibacter fluminis]NQD37975.1 methionine adenosyltransferase [Permianibacter fluminis]